MRCPVDHHAGAGPAAHLPALWIWLLVAGCAWTAQAAAPGWWLHRWHPIEPSPGQLGVLVRDVTGDTVRRLGLPGEFGAYVEKVIAGSPADEAGLRVEDVLIEWNDQRVESVRQLIRMVQETPPGRRARCTVVRAGAELEIEVVTAPVRAAPWLDWPGWRPPDRVEPWPTPPPLPPDEIRSGRSLRGLTLQPLTAQLADYFGLEGPGGALISSVQPGTAAAEAGLRAGDVLVTIGGSPVRDPGDVQDAIRSAGDSVDVEIMRDRRRLRVPVQLDPAGPPAGGSEPDRFPPFDDPLPPGAI